MKLAFFNDYRLGVVRGAEVIDVTADVEDIPHRSRRDLMQGLIERFDAYRGCLEAAAKERSGLPLSGVSFRPPLPQPGQIVCMAVNYMEDGTRTEPAPLNAFLKTPDAVIGPGDEMTLPDLPATVFEGEAELAVVISKRAVRVQADEAMNYVFGYMNFMDGSARALPPAGNTFYRVKSLGSFAPTGPFIVTADEISNLANMQVRLWNNGILKQDFNTSDMAHDVSSCIEFVTTHHALNAGDILATGTNHRGLHAFQDGDRVEMEVAGLGRLSFSVRDPLKRTWPRETRLERKNLGLEERATQLTGKYAQP